MTSGLVVLTLVAAGAAYRFDLGPRLGLAAPSPLTEPAEVAPPPGLTLPGVPAAEPVAGSAQAVAADPRAVRQAVRGPLGDRRLGPRVAVAVSLLSDGTEIYRVGPARVVPASTMKLLTSAAALARLGGAHRFRTAVVRSTNRREVILVGGGDPMLARKPVTEDGVYPPRADVATLARTTAQALREEGRMRVRLGYDASLFRGPGASPGWESSYLPDDVVTPIGALWVDEGLSPDGQGRSADPARDAAEAFASALRKRGIAVAGRPRVTEAVSGAREIAVVESAPLAQVVERVLDVSDNEGAEVLARHVALAAGEPPTFAGANRAVLATLAGLGVGAGRDRVLDGSGLARGNRVAPETLLQVLETAASPDHPELRPLLTGLPVAGFTGSLATRFDTGSPLGLGRVRAKTGTLSGVHGLAGTVTTRDGVVLAFAAVADRVQLADTLDARALLDRLAAALAACRCAA